MSKVLFTICTYNEVQNIRLLLPRLRAIVPEADVLVIDDNSPDGTGDAVREFSSHDSQIQFED